MYNRSCFGMKKIATIGLYILVGLSLIALFIRFGVKPLTNLLGHQPRAGIKVTSNPTANVYINGRQVGKTPYENNALEVGQYQVKVEEGSYRWENPVQLNKGTVTIVNRDFAASQTTNSGEVLTLNTGSGVVIATSPSGASIEIDGNSAGKSPISLSNLPVGEHTFIIKHENHLARSIQAYLPENMTLTMDIDLAANDQPAPASVAAPIPTPAVVQTVIVKDTPNGFLRVREKASTSSKEIGRVSEGDSITMIEESLDWIKIRLEDGKEGYVSAQYVEKQ